MYSKRDWVTCLHNHSLAIAGSGAGLEAHVCPDDGLIKRPRLQFFAILSPCNHEILCSYMLICLFACLLSLDVVLS